MVIKSPKGIIMNDLELSKEIKEDIKLLRSLTNTMHTLLCKRDHKTMCQFYKEELDFESTWTLEAHIDWLQITKTFMRINKIDAKIMSSILEFIMKNTKHLNELLFKYPKSINLLQEVFDDIFKAHHQDQN